MTAEQGFRSSCFHSLKGRKCIHVRQQVFVLTVRTAMNKQQLVSAQCHGKLRQKGFVLIRQCCGRPVVSTMASPFRQLGGITAFTGVQSVNDVFIPAPLAGKNFALTHQLHHLIGLRSVTNKVAKTGDGFDALAINVVENGLNRCQVGVQTGDNGMLHVDQPSDKGVGCCCRSCCCCMASTSSASRQSLMVVWIPSGLSALPCTTSSEVRLGRPWGGAVVSSGRN